MHDGINHFSRPTPHQNLKKLGSGENYTAPTTAITAANPAILGEDGNAILGEDGKPILFE